MLSGGRALTGFRHFRSTVLKRTRVGETHSGGRAGRQERCLYSQVRRQRPFTAYRIAGVRQEAESTRGRRGQELSLWLLQEGMGEAG